VDRARILLLGGSSIEDCIFTETAGSVVSEVTGRRLILRVLKPADTTSFAFGSSTNEIVVGTTFVIL
jgi:hypothetical protein